ncbi:DUF1631 family protein [Caenimonas sedimenti]|uniref:DUF1631 family protein n=1 Tax=Caenimonas sedimenti TaxID=2596921 RepID=UPI001644E899|nr:DUF1631 family protein [Caenimonas sedimenti]
MYRATVKSAATLGGALLQGMLARALARMPGEAQASTDVVERNLLADAATVLADHSAALLDSFPQALLAEFAHALAGGRGGALTFDSLPLLGEEQVRDNVDVLRVTQDVLEAVRPELGELESLLAAAQGPGTPGRHPLRPEVFVRALHRLVQQSPVAATVRRRWLRHLGAELGTELAGLYRELTATLRAHGVAAAAPAMAAAPPPSPERQTDLTVRELQRLLAGELDLAAPGNRPPFADTEFSATIPAAFEQLREMRQVDQVMQQLRQRQAAVPDPAGEGRSLLRNALLLQVRRPAQALALEVVRLMVDNLAADPRLLPAVQEAVRDLEPALMRLALADPRFFSERQHPARQLLEQATQRSLAWADEGAPGFAEFAGALREAVEALLDSRAVGPEVFQIALDTLQGAWAEAQPRGRRLREKAVRALLRAEQRNLLAERIAQQLAGRPEAAGAPAEVMSFLGGPWAQVMAQARLADRGGSDDPGGYAAAAATLLRSVQPALAMRVFPHRQALAERLRHGLASVDYLPAETQRWLSTFDVLQEHAAMETAPPALPETPAPPGDTWLAALEAHDSGFVPLPAVSSAAEHPVWPPELPGIDLQPGAWVDLLGATGWERWQLTWASPHGLLFMFTDATGTARSMTRRSLQDRLAGGSLRTVSAHTVVDGALDAVARVAWRNSV